MPNGDIPKIACDDSGFNKKNTSNITSFIQINLTLLRL